MDPNLRRNRAFLTFLGNLRAGADVRTAAVVAGIGVPAGTMYAAAERRGEYRDIVAIEPGWKIAGDTLQIRLQR